MPIENAPAVRKRSTNLAQGVVDALTQCILLGQLKPGEKLPSESTIVLEHGVSRTVVREAISKLQASGLVETRHGIGTFVLAQHPQQGLRLHVDTVASVRNMLELRLGLEVQAVALAALRRTDAQLAHMRQALDDYQASLASNDSCVEEDKRFHQLIAEATGNTFFSEIMQHLGTAMIPRTLVVGAERGGADFAKLGQLANLEHEAIFNAIKRQDPDAARAAMVLHLTNSRDRFSGE
ncbi:FadR/GntR family transcriptional regulator [Pseudomonas sp. W4I3]|uniref:FadR/GntR family transcriptional regulator n=1 Tax=Pseudomonas sp. W4I3 TaxID=3042294 RepID=UPI0027812AA8|nr:FadR/GntR family transcriptional regulator [Pseudomonas sp. W4I3]MDQ0741372.1 GntR family transcriptional repressor for pyruvate dehydrogenase complex [Pseudomonas sp. W4I3]